LRRAGRRGRRSGVPQSPNPSLDLLFEADQLVWDDANRLDAVQEATDDVGAVVLLKGAEGFREQSNDNKVFSGPYAACRSADGRRWVITAWEPCHRPWGNPPLRGKPCAVIGASMSPYGAAWAQAEARRVLTAIGAQVIDMEWKTRAGPKR
jgi:hypothetical protein